MPVKLKCVTPRVSFPRDWSFIPSGLQFHPLGTEVPAPTGLEFHSLGTGVSPTRDCPACPGLMHSSFTAKDLILVRETDTQTIGWVYSL